ncbi:hypothetical protein E2374_23405 [Salmonella enterica subsp. enterica serovar Newport]|nr:hypothetical protein [Salmonella enterica subsp. enterica serovar Newport]ECR5064070.1 hypothetical protein [Salmonella enterica]EDA8687203.1 hypothetical protein [Salmonella enterica subsp. enterica serovar Newport]
MQISGREIKHSYQNNGKQKYNANPHHNNKYGFIHCSLAQNSVPSESSRWKQAVEVRCNTIRMGTSFS